MRSRNSPRPPAWKCPRRTAIGRKAERAKGLHDLMADAGVFVDQLNGIPAPKRGRAGKRGIKAKRRPSAWAFPGGRKLRGSKSYGGPALIEGMLIKVDKEPYDSFRGRLMIPIRDQGARDRVRRTRVMGWRAQILNSPDTALRRGTHALQSRPRPPRPQVRPGRGRGYMDVIALARAGFGEAWRRWHCVTEHQLERCGGVQCRSRFVATAGKSRDPRRTTPSRPRAGRSLRFVTCPGSGPRRSRRARARRSRRCWKRRILGRSAVGHELAEPLTRPEERQASRGLTHATGADPRRHEYQQFRAASTIFRAPALISPRALRPRRAHGCLPAPAIGRKRWRRGIDRCWPRPCFRVDPPSGGNRSSYGSTGRPENGCGALDDCSKP